MKEKRKTKINTIKQLLDNNFKDLPQRSNSTYIKRGRPGSTVFDFLALVRGWEDIVGPKLSKRTLPLKQTGNYLTILSDHPGFSHALSFIETELIGKIRKSFPNIGAGIKRINFQTNPQFFLENKARQDKIIASESKETDLEQQNYKLHPQSPHYRKIKAQADEEYKDIEDSEIKESLISIYIQTNIK